MGDLALILLLGVSHVIHLLWWASSQGPSEGFENVLDWQPIYTMKHGRSLPSRSLEKSRLGHQARLLILLLPNLHNVLQVPSYMPGLVTHCG
jgi:hypothetical protein